MDPQAIAQKVGPSGKYCEWSDCLDLKDVGEVVGGAGAGVLLLCPEESYLSWALSEGRQGFGTALNPQPYADTGT